MRPDTPLPWTRMWSPSHSAVNPRLPEFVRDLVENDWKNHGTYVRFVAHASEDLLQSGLIGEVGKDTLVSSAAGSSCCIKK